MSSHKLNAKSLPIIIRDLKLETKKERVSLLGKNLELNNGRNISHSAHPMSQILSLIKLVEFAN